MVLLHALMENHPNKELVNEVHCAFLRSEALRDAYLQGAWDSFSIAKSQK